MLLLYVYRHEYGELWRPAANHARAGIRIDGQVYAVDSSAAAIEPLAAYLDPVVAAMSMDRAGLVRDV